MTQSIEHTILSRIYGTGRGWVFSQKDLSQLGSRAAIDLSLHRLLKKGVIRRVIRGIYDYPLFSELLDQELSPDIDQVAQALARKFGWRIAPSGPAALNLIGLSTQVPGRTVYLSDGPTKSYSVGGVKLTFKNKPLKEAAFNLFESALIVQGLKSLGPDSITNEVIEQIRNWLSPELRKKVIKDTQTVTGWIYSAIRRICQDKRSG